VTVEFDNKFAFKAILRGHEHERLQSCSIWPEKSESGQECLAQINPLPENLENLLQKWYQYKSCATCPRPLSSPDGGAAVSRCSMKSRSSGVRLHAL